MYHASVADPIQEEIPMSDEPKPEFGDEEPDDAVDVEDEDEEDETA